MSEPPTVALSEEDLAEILKASEQIAILVGGQALAVWANFYQISVPEPLTAFVTRDADFIGTAETAFIIKGALSNKDWKLVQVRSGAPSLVTAQLTLETASGVKEIDFLASIVGLATDDVRTRAVALRLTNGSTVTLLHPLDVLASRLHNLAQISEKRDAKGIAQARLAIDIVGAFLREYLRRGAEREIFNHIERLRAIVTNELVAPVCREFALDVLACVPVNEIRNENFKARRWPQIQRDVRLAVGRISAATEP